MTFMLVIAVCVPCLLVASQKYGPSSARVTLCDIMRTLCLEMTRSFRRHSYVASGLARAEHVTRGGCNPSTTLMEELEIIVFSGGSSGRIVGKVDYSLRKAYRQVARKTRICKISRNYMSLIHGYLKTYLMHKNSIGSSLLLMFIYKYFLQPVFALALDISYMRTNAGEHLPFCLDTLSLELS